MLTIKKLRADHVLDFAAEELKKYLRMMMPECGEIDISYDPDAKDGFRLGLLEDFGLPSEAEDPVLDDVLHIDTTPEGGILAGSNPRSVLFSVYRFLRENGCRWLYPGVDGDYVPMKDIEAVSYHKLADHRFRGFCNEGAESQTCMLECADYYAKLEMNVYMMEWFVPNGYYNRYYCHLHNGENRIPEEVDDNQILQWKRQCEAEISKRGLMFHDIGHGWTTRTFGYHGNFAVSLSKPQMKTVDCTEEQRSYIALYNGKRAFTNSDPNFTNACLSNPKVRTLMVQDIADYAQSHHNIDFLHVWLSDGQRNHCECDECKKMLPTDWYMMIMNELDEELTKRNLSTRIVFISYLDTMFAPQQVKLNNPQRFSLLHAPITRTYQSSVQEDTKPIAPPPYTRNAWETPTQEDATFGFLRQWQKMFDGPVFSYEYHFWRHQYLDPGGQSIARRLYEDVRSLKYMDLSGYVQDGSQRSGFPNAFPVYVYANTLMDRELDYEELAADYFSHIYGPDWQEAVNILKQISAAFDFGFMEGTKSLDPENSDYYNPEIAQRILAVGDLCAQERILAQKHLNMPTRPQTVSWRLLLRHAEYCELWSKILWNKAMGYNFKAQELAAEFAPLFGKYELEMERYYDHYMACLVLEHITRRPRGLILN